MLILYLSYYLKEDKKKSQREAKPPNMIIGSFRGTKSLLIKNLSLPFVKGKGIG